jgi:hypothetical protein
MPLIQHCVGVARAPRQIEAPDGGARRRAEGPGPDPIKAQNPSHANRPNRGRPVGVRRWTWPPHTMPLETQMSWRETIRLILLAVLIAALGTAAIKILVTGVCDPVAALQGKQGTSVRSRATKSTARWKPSTYSAAIWVIFTSIRLVSRSNLRSQDRLAHARFRKKAVAAADCREWAHGTGA